MKTLLHLLTVCFVAQLGWPAPAAPAWRETAPGLAVCTLPATHGKIALTVTAARIDPARCAIRVVDRSASTPRAGATARDVCPTPGAAINAAFFDEKGAPLGLLVIDGTQRRPRHPVSGWPGGGGLLVVRKGRPSLLPHTARVPAGADYAVQCWPRLVIAGTIPKFKQRPAAFRSAVGLDAQGRLLFAVTDGPVTFEQWAAILRDRLGCVDALNLDGGPSTQLAVNGKIPVTVPGLWPVPVLIVAEVKGTR